MLDRYKKKGGFAQLLILIETCGQPKQDKFLEMIRSEDVNWHAGIQKKMLTMKRILSWPEETVAEVFGQINELMVATAFLGLGDELKNKMFKYISVGQQRRITSIMETKVPNAAETATVYNKIIEEVRNLINTRTLRAEKFDPSTIIEENVEELLTAGHFLDASYAASMGVPDNVKHVDFGGPEPVKAAPATSDEAKVEIANLNKRVAQLHHENLELKRKVKQLEDKLEQIRRIA